MKKSEKKWIPVQIPLTVTLRQTSSIFSFSHPVDFLPEMRNTSIVMRMQNFQILLYYKYVNIEDPALVMAAQKAFCEALGLKGRIIVAKEGINGTVEGTLENTEKYIAWMNTDRRFRNIHWKKSAGLGDSFPKLSVKVRNEIVSLHLHDDINPNEVTGKHLPPAELQKWYTEGKEFYIVDMRNDYELKVGKFENTIFPGLKNFRDLRDKVSELDYLKDKPVLTVCTGGVRCEKASGFLKTKGFNEVYQLDGGIVSYMEKFPSQAFKGSLYVFDKRITMHFDDPVAHEIIGRCGKCEKPSERYVNCAYPMCHDHLIICETCDPDENKSFCTPACEQKKFGADDHG
jgi:UPF0176 protein